MGEIGEMCSEMVLVVLWCCNTTKTTFQLTALRVSLQAGGREVQSILFVIRLRWESMRSIGLAGSGYLIS